MRVTAIEPVIVGNPWKNWVLVRVETDAGIEGVGEATLEHRTKAVEAAVRELSPYLLGRDPADVEAMHDTVRLETYTPGILVRTVLSGFDMACWDILGKWHRQPLYRLWGGQVRERIGVYANGWYRVERTPEAFAAACADILARGYRAVKFDPFGAARLRLDSEAFGQAMGLVEAVAEVCRKMGAEFIVEGHARFDRPTAKRIAKAIEPLQPLWFEEPVVAQDVAGNREVRRITQVPIAAGERGVWLRDFLTLLSEGEVDIVQPDIAHVGGFSGARKVAALAEAFDRSVTFHCPLSPVTTAASLQLAASVPHAHLQECFDHVHPPWVAEVFGPPPAVEAGTVAVPTAPGLGIAVNWEAASRHPYHPANRQNLYRPGWERRQGLPRAEDGAD